MKRKAKLRAGPWMIKVVLGLLLFQGSRVFVEAATAANVELRVTIGNALAITSDQTSIGFGSFNLGDGMTLITTPIRVTNQTTSVVADLALSAYNWGGDGSGEAAVLSAWVNSATSEGQDFATLAAVFVSAGNTVTPGMYPISTTALKNDSSASAVSQSAKEATAAGDGTCAAADVFCNAVANDKYPTVTVGGTNFYLGDGQNLTLGEVVSLNLFFRPPTTMTFDSTSLSTTLSIVASAGGSEE